MPILRISIEDQTIERTLTRTPITIGRQPGLDVTIPAKGASREHAQMGRLKDGSWALKDLGSTNGTLLNGEKIATARLKDGDVIQIGNCSLEYIDVPEPAPEPVAVPEPEPEPVEKKPIALVSKKDRKRGGAVPVSRPSKAPKARKGTKKDVANDTAEDQPPEEVVPDLPSERIDSEEKLEAWLKNADEMDRVIQAGEKRFLFGKYELIKRLSEGGMGVVFKARHIKNKLIVALKVMKTERVDENGIARFKQEAWAISAFDHPNIVKVRDLAMHGGMHYIAMDFIDGEDLLAAGFKKHLTFWQVADIIDKLADVLSLVHGRNIWHRDIKPQNLILDSKQEIKLIDFGIAMVEREQTDATKTADGLIMGTPAFLSPEQAARGKMGPVDGRADLYSLGAVMYYLLTGRRPFTGKTALEILANNMKKAPPHPVDVDEHVPEGLAEIAMKLLQKRPAERIQSAEALRDGIAKWRRTADGKEELARHKKIMKLRERKAKAKAK
jgi:pSer/pThr/pTyr-binding forkhead associated (FHA) protein/tRNA A-37 threonylcarbamoyl transferase component Bud32